MSRPDRSYLFVPGNRPDRFAKAARAGADAVVLDLEDAVSPAEKNGAREAVVAWLADEPGWVRVNGLGTAWGDEDLRALTGAAQLQGVMVPKAADPVALERIHERLGGRPLIALVETAAGVLNAPAVAKASGVHRLALGHLDLTLDLGLVDSDRPDEALRWSRSTLVLASAAAGLPGPVEGVHPNITDTAGLESSTRLAKDLGFAGRLCIHPAQVPIVHDALRPSETSLAWARQVVATMQPAGAGVATLDGEMLDAPQVGRAHRLLELAAEEAR